MRRFESFAVLVWLLVSALLHAPAWSQEPATNGKFTPHRSEARAANTEPPMSIFNDQLRRFKFLLEHDVATAETAEAFMQRYRRPNSPRIIGAYPDAQTNSLIVIGPPESEQAIRERLAEWIVESGGLGQSSPLSMQLRILQQERTACLEKMSDIEVQKVKAAAIPTEKAKEPQFAARLQAFAGKLEIVEQQIQVVRKYMDRLERDDSAQATDGRPAQAGP